MTKQRLILTALLCCLAFSLSYAWKQSPRQQLTSKQQNGDGVSTASTKVRTSPARPQTGQVAVINRLALPEPPAPPLQIKRDLFQTPAEKRTTTKPATAKQALPPAPPPPPPPPTKQELARRELQQYRVMGFLKHEGRHTAFVTKANKVQLVHTGDMLTADYKITKINGYRLVVRSEDGDEMQLSGR